MKTFILLYDGPPTPPDATHEGWPEWFRSLGDKLVDTGSPMTAGFAVGAAADRASTLNGYSLIRAEDQDEARELVQSHPLLAGGSAYTVQVFEVPAKSG